MAEAKPEDQVKLPFESKTKTATPIDKQESEPLESHYLNLIKEYKLRGHSQRSDEEQPDLGQKPEWFNEELFNQAKSVYARHFMGVNFAHLSGLLLLVRVDSIYRTLVLTGKSATVAKLFKRYYHTIVHVKKWYEGDIFEDNSEAQRSLRVVRGMHNGVSKRLNNEHASANNIATNMKSTNLEGDDMVALDDNHNVDEESKLSLDEQSKLVAEPEQQVSAERPHPVATAATTSISKLQQQQRPDESRSKMVHISQYDILLTQFAFIGFIVTNPKQMGLIDDFSEKDLESLLHFWRVIGYYLGAKDGLNLCGHELKDVCGLCDAVMEIEFKDSIIKNPLESPQGLMSINIVRSVKFIPLITFYGIMKYLYELMGMEFPDEIESRRTCYSNMSYTFIKLVMSNLLGYWPLRSFNNGITRLSVHLVGKVEDWFSNRLESSYGQELKL